MNLRRYIALTTVCAALLGCASTKVETSGSGLKEPLCQVGTSNISSLVYWGPQWRPDQKEPTRREAAALRGIQEFFGNTQCVSAVEIRRIPGEQTAGALSDEWLLRMANTMAPIPDRVVLIVVRELGPRLLIGLPVILEGGTEVVIDVRVLKVNPPESMANVQTHWRNGGKFVVKGVKTLDQDMSAALRSALMASAAPQ
jgi:hypothetical protein